MSTTAVRPPTPHDLRRSPATTGRPSWRHPWDNNTARAQRAIHPNGSMGKNGRWSGQGGQRISAPASPFCVSEQAAPHHAAGGGLNPRGKRSAYRSRKAAMPAGKPRRPIARPAKWSASGYSDAILGYVTGSRTFAMCGFVLSTPSGSSAAESFLCLRSHRSLLE